MSGHNDLFGFQAAQGSLFGDGEGRMRVPRRDTAPDPEKIRHRLSTLLTTVKSAPTMPWDRKEALMWRTVFPQMANWLPDEEAAQLRFDFEREMERLDKAA